MVVRPRMYAPTLIDVVLSDVDDDGSSRFRIHENH